MYYILLVSYFLLTINGISIDTIEKDLNNSIEKILLINNNLFVGTINSLHRLSSKTLNQNLFSLKLGPQLDHSFCRTCIDPRQIDYHFKTLLLINKHNHLLLCGTLSQGVCQIVDENFNLIINSSLPIVANDPINSTIGLIIQEQNLIYFGVTYKNEGIYRWQIPNISGRSLNLTNFMKILSSNDDETIYRDDLSLRFMPRQQTTFIIQYIHSFYTENYVYFVTNQPNDIDQTNAITKIIRFCRNSSNSIIRSYTEIPLVCLNSDWIIKSAQIIIDNNNQMILIGLFIKRSGSTGTNICSWKVHNDIDKAFQDNYKNCYTMGIGQRGLSFIKPNEACRKVEGWSKGMTTNDNNICPWIISDRLPYPVGGLVPIVGRLFYENSFESSSALQLYPFGSSTLFLQGLTNGTFKLGIFDFALNINWKYSYQLSTQLPILSDILFDNRTASFFLASGSKIHHLSFAGDCASHLSCDECLSSSNNVFCGWCSTTERCSVLNDCPSNNWQQENDQCIHIINVQPLNTSIDQSQWINLTLSKLPQLERNEIYQCIFADKTMSASTQAIKLDYNRLSCPTPSNHFRKENVHIQIGNESKVRLSIVKWPSNTSIATIPEFIFYDCSSYSSCESCRSQQGCQWCSDRCSSICTEKTIKQCPSFNLIDNSNIFIESGKSIDIPLKFYNTIKSSLECRLNETMAEFIDERNICHISKTPELINENDQTIYLSLYENNISIGSSIKMFIYRCDLYDSCDECQSRLTCSWCQGKCITKTDSQCLTNSPCTSLKIKDFSPKKLPLNGETLVTIYLNELITDEILEITLADIPCLNIKSTKRIECQSKRSNSSRLGPIKIHFKNSIILFSKEYIQYCQSSLVSFNPTIVYEFGGQILHITGNNLIIGNQQRVFIGNFQCITIKQTITNVLTCRLPLILSGSYNVTVIIDNKTVLNNGFILKITPQPLVEDINPKISFASGGRLVTVRGMYFTSVQLITVEFSYKKWSAKLKITSNNIISTNNDMKSSFSFRTPGIPSPSNEFSSPPIDVDFFLYFDNTILSSNSTQFHYIPDVLLNVSSKLPILPYTGEELKLQVENLTEAASMADIQLFVGCTECKLRTFTSKGITCQPPTKLITNTPLILHNQPDEVACTLHNSSIGPIRFHIGFREYVIGYLSYIRSPSLSSSRYSVSTIIYLSLASCLLTIALLTLGLCLYIKLRKSREKSSSLSPIKSIEQNDKAFWSTTTSAIAGPYYQVYEQIPSSSSHQNTLTRAPLLFCPYHHHHHHYKQEYSTLSLMQQLESKAPYLTNLSIEHEQLKKLIFTSDNTYNFSNRRQSMELFYDLLGMTPFSEAFIDHLVINDCHDLLKYYGYIFRYNPLNLKSFPLTQEILIVKLVSTFLFQSKNNLYELFYVFDKLINSLIDLIDSGPCDQLLNRSANSISSSTLLSNNIDYNCLELLINYENLISFQLPVLDCDTIDQIKEKIVHHLNSYERTFHEQIDLMIPLSNICSCTNQMPVLKQYSINSTILCRKKSAWNNFSDKVEKNLFMYHLCRENQLINDKYLINENLKANKKRLQKVLNNFYEEILNGLKFFSIWEKQIDDKSQKDLFQKYIQLVSDVIRRLNTLMICRSACPIIQSCLNVIADGLEFIFQTKNKFSSEIELLFEDDRKYFSSFDTNLFKVPSCSLIDSLPSSLDIRSLILDDHTAIECLFKLYQFYELHSEPINQHIGENHVSVLLPVHHLLVQIRQLINSDTMRTTTTII
ncbi:unnamed protein product [Rotaria socialis]|uniref:Sema domain-containing protein n=1 Tax=Rotaria socialis TaxID=392032 RepID=A0A818FF05_9BILA|nr:unnamed protein product [Rotaria socialis]CAF4509760.1 unnamed protein product [Rotaria socialis]